jgi:drug/metabolite transporter (DMT)-like permease
MPLATVWTIAFSAPLIVTALSRPLLGEPVGIRRWAGVLVGFAGVLIVIQPGTARFEWAMLLALAGTLSYSLLLMTARKFAASETAPAMVLFNMLVPLAIATVITPAVWTVPAGWDWLAFVGAGLLGGSAMIFLTLGYRLAPAAVVAPFDYTALIWSVALGWLIWRDWPTPATWTGAALIVAAGLYIAYRETRVHRRAKAPATDTR